MAKVTPGFWNEVFAGPLIGANPVTVALIPGGSTFYLWYASLTIYGPNDVGPGNIIWLAADGVPFISINGTNKFVNASFPKPIPIVTNLTAGLQGTFDNSKNLFIAYYGEAT